MSDDWPTSDYVVVGSGSAGSTVAARLSEDPDSTVLVLEAGPADDDPQLDVPMAAGRLLKSRFDWADRSQPEPGLGGRIVELSHGRVVGGSSSINSMIYLRGTRADYDDWARAGAAGWAYDDVLPYFRRAEDNERGDSQFHGTGGPLGVSDGRWHHPLSRTFLAAAQEAGYPLLGDLNGPCPDGVGFVQVTQRHGRRCSAARAYLHPALPRANLGLMTDTQVLEIIFEGTRAVGVLAEHAGTVRLMRAAREVIVAAGAYYSPQLLLVSGIGPADHLRELGVTVRQDLPVGQNLQDHFRQSLAFRTHVASLRSSLTPAALDQFHRLGTGPYCSNVAEAAGFIRSRPGVAAPDFEVVGVPVVAGTMLGLGEAGVSLIGWPSKPASTGEVRLAGPDMSVRPRVRHNYLTSDADRQVTTDGIRRLLEISRQRSLREVLAGEPISVPASDSDADIIEWAARVGATAHHPCGTCAIGQVVDPELKVLGLDGLRIVDASVMPSVTRSNTNAVVMMIGEKAADCIRAGVGPAGAGPARAEAHHVRVVTASQETKW